MSSWWILSIGFLAQLLFSARLVTQWILSEQQQRVVTPKLFWVLSLLASVLLFSYGVMRNDTSIMLGQCLTYYIYIRNLQLQNTWKDFSKGLRWAIISFPILLLSYCISYNTIQFKATFFNEDIPFWLLAFGIIAQVVFVLRFIYQWLISETKKQSILPLGFWVLSLIGAFLILIYGIFRKDLVLIIGHSFGILIYSRNIYFNLKERKDS